MNVVSKSFGNVAAVRKAQLEVGSSEIVALLGPSGCGKTTLFRLLAGFEEPGKGQISLNGQTMANAETSVVPEQRHVGMVFQDYALFPHLTASENVGYGIPRAERELRVPAVLAVVGLCGLGERYPNELSGGQQQRVALARALAPGPKVILLDEPWSNIDPLLHISMRDELARVLRPIGFDTLATEVWKFTEVGAYSRAALPALLLIAVAVLPSDRPANAAARACAGKFALETSHPDHLGC